MAQIRIISDSACDVPEEIARRLDIDIVSLSIRFGDEEFTDRVDLTPSQFWAKCKKSKTLPETAAPSPGAFQAAYERAKSDGCAGAIVLTLSAALSATHQSATLAAEAVASEFTVKVVDTKAVSMAQGLLTIEIAELAQAGATLDELVEHAEALTSKVGVIAMLDTLEHLVKGIVEYPDEVRVDSHGLRRGRVLEVRVHPEDLGKVIGRGGRTAKALRTVIGSLAGGKYVRVDLLDVDEVR